MAKLLRSGLLALILTALSLSLTTFAQTSSSADQTNRTEYSGARDDRDWGWLGLLGLAGLAGLLRRRDARDRDYVPDSSRTAAR